MTSREQMNIIVVGHVDHGKSTVIGRLLADTNSLPQGKLEAVRAQCDRNARPFEYAFLLDALKDEQAQGITIDTARCFFKSAQRDYIIIDAPGHVEFLKNMVSGAARAEAALLVIDAHEGIQDNSRRHGYLMSMLDIPHIVVLVNKMDLVGWKKETFDAIVAEYGEFLARLGMKPAGFVPLCARDGENLASPSTRAAWYTGKTVLEQIDAFVKQSDDHFKPLRMPVQDVYKFTEAGDDRRIIAGTIETGLVAVGDRVTFMPSGKHSIITSIEGFNTPKRESVGNGHATGVRLKDELYLPRGEIMCRSSEQPPLTGSRFRANIFWMGRAPLIKGRKYKIKIATARQNVRLVEVLSSIDATDLSSSSGKHQVDRHDVAECILETTRPIAFDTIDAIQATGRFVIVDNFDIAGGGIITAVEKGMESEIGEQVRLREILWDRGLVDIRQRQQLFGHQARFLLVTGDPGCIVLAKMLEQKLIGSGKAAYYLGLTSLSQGLDADVTSQEEQRSEQIRRLGELARILTDTGLLFITALVDCDSFDRNLLRKLTAPFEFAEICCGNPGADINALIVDSREPGKAIATIICTLIEQDVLPDYMI